MSNEIISFQYKLNQTFHYTRRITPKRVTSSTS